MGTIETYTYTKSELEESCDVAKTAIVQALVKEGMLDETEAEQWCKTHTIMIRNKPFFRTLTDRWRKHKEDTTKFYYTVVKDLLQKDEPEPELDRDLKMVKS